MIELPSVTLIALTGINVEQHLKALKYSCRGINFGAVKLIERPSKDINEWSKTIVYDLGDYVDTEFAILIHADGFIVHPELWKNEWLQYDYIGSPWMKQTEGVNFLDPFGNYQRVGNSVSLRSKKLLDLPKKINLEWRSFYGYYNEDGFICVQQKHIFEQHGCKYAPFEVAVEFGKETPLPENKGKDTFLFHTFGGENRKYWGLI